MKKILLIISLFLLTACDIGGTEMDPIVIGGIAPLGGSNILYGEWGVKTVDLQIEEINAAGGINGRDLQIVWMNGRCDRETAMKATQQLIKDYDVKIILGGVCSDETLGAAPIVEENQVVLLSATSTAPQISQAGEFIFRTAPSNIFSGKLLAQYVADSGFKKIGMIFEPTDYTSSLSQSFQKYYSGELEIVDVMDHVAIKALGESDVDAIFININSFRLLSELTQGATNYDLDKVIILNELMAGGIEIMATYSEIPYMQEIVGVVFDIDFASDKLQAFQAKYSERYNRETNYWRFAAMALDGIDVITEVLRNVEDVNDEEALLEAMKAVQHIGYSGPIRFDTNGDVLNTQVIMRFDGHKFIPIEK